jgi:hypothetical protein
MNLELQMFQHFTNKHFQPFTACDEWNFIKMVNKGSGEEWKKESAEKVFAF